MADIKRYYFEQDVIIQRDYDENILLIKGDNFKKFGKDASKVIVLLSENVPISEIAKEISSGIENKKVKVEFGVRKVVSTLIEQGFLRKNTVSINSDSNITIKSFNEVALKMKLVKSSDLVKAMNIFNILLAFVTLAAYLILPDIELLYGKFSLFYALLCIATTMLSHELSHFFCAKYLGYSNVCFGLTKLKLFYGFCTKIPVQIGITHPENRAMISIAGPFHDTLMLMIVLIVSTITKSELLYFVSWYLLFNLFINTMNLKGTDGSNNIRHLKNSKLVAHSKIQILVFNLCIAVAVILGVFFSLSLESIVIEASKSWGW